MACCRSEIKEQSQRSSVDLQDVLLFFLLIDDDGGYCFSSRALKDGDTINILLKDPDTCSLPAVGLTSADPAQVNPSYLPSNPLKPSSLFLDSVSVWKFADVPPDVLSKIRPVKYDVLRLTFEANKRNRKLIFQLNTDAFFTLKFHCDETEPIFLCIQTRKGDSEISVWDDAELAEWLSMQHVGTPPAGQPPVPRRFMPKFPNHVVSQSSGVPKKCLYESTSAVVKQENNVDTSTASSVNHSCSTVDKDWSTTGEGDSSVDEDEYSAEAISDMKASESQRETNCGRHPFVGMEFEQSHGWPNSSTNAWYNDTDQWESFEKSQTRVKTKETKNEASQESKRIERVNQQYKDIFVNGWVDRHFLSPSIVELRRDGLVPSSKKITVSNGVQDNWRMVDEADHGPTADIAAQVGNRSQDKAIWDAIHKTAECRSEFERGKQRERIARLQKAAGITKTETAQTGSSSQMTQNHFIQRQQELVRNQELRLDSAFRGQQITDPKTQLVGMETNGVGRETDRVEDSLSDILSPALVAVPSETAHSRIKTQTDLLPGRGGDGSGPKRTVVPLTNGHEPGGSLRQQSRGKQSPCGFNQIGVGRPVSSVSRWEEPPVPSCRPPTAQGAFRIAGRQKVTPSLQDNSDDIQTPAALPPSDARSQFLQQNQRNRRNSRSTPQEQTASEKPSSLNREGLDDSDVGARGRGWREREATPTLNDATAEPSTSNPVAENNDIQCLEQFVSSGSKDTSVPRAPSPAPSQLSTETAIARRVCQCRWPCVVCTQNPIQIVLTPCGHMCMCEECFKRFQDAWKTQNKECPVCQQKVRSWAKVIFYGSAPAGYTE